MKLSPSFVVSALLGAASASRVGHVYTYDPAAEGKASSQQPSSSVTPETARLILAQRLGLSRYHSIKNANDETIEHINAYAGSQRRLFGAEKERSESHTLIWVEDVEDVTAIVKDQSPYSATFTIADPPPAAANDRLLADFILQAESLPKKHATRLSTYTTNVQTDILLEGFEAGLYSDYLTVLRASKEDKLDMSKLQSSLAELIKKSSNIPDQGWPITLILMPPSSSHSKRSANPYGPYDVPASLDRAREPTEAPLASSSPVTPSDLEDFPTIQQANDTSPVLGILPVCFETLALCIRTTHNCSSHGECKLLHKAAGGKDGTKDCYGCACVPTKHFVDGKGNEEGLSVTYWGGPACQKMDISVPFFLFASIGILLAGLIAAAIGLMFSMGNEELPSVIGAGVSGPQRK